MAEFKNKTVLEILNYYKNLWALSYVSGVVHWDLETYMPPMGAAARGEALAKVSTLHQKLYLDPGFKDLIHTSANQKDLNDAEKAVVRVMLHGLKFYEKLPPDFLEDFEKLTNKATIIWREAKLKNDYKLFEPHLNKIFEMSRKMADYLGFEGSPYDALLDQYEEGLKASGVEKFFTQIKDPLKTLVNSIVNSKNFHKSDKLTKMKYDKNKMVELNEKVLRTFYPEFGQKLRLDVSAHPFTTSFSNTDTRITTWYQPKSFGESLLAVIHEFGHALYDLQCDDSLEMTPAQGGRSLVIHESQSRFWENFVGRSEKFIDSIIDDLRYVTGNKEITTKEVYDHFNAVEPSLIRVEADEVTYHFHIMLRFEIEQGIMEGKYKFSDLREIWNSKVQDYTGIKPQKDSDGVLQDVHWSSGMVGYFPTYSLGTFLGAQWEQKLNNELQSMDYGSIREWLKTHIHEYGSTYTLSDLLNKNGMEFDPTVNLKYLQDKYAKIYGF
jgi:carboxypeptidase Taq